MTQRDVFRPKNWESLDCIDDTKIAEIAGETARARIWSSPTLKVFNKAFATGDREEIRSRPDWRIMPPDCVRVTSRRASGIGGGKPASDEARRKRYVDVRNRLVKAIDDSGGKIIAGSDTPEWFFAYGWGFTGSWRRWWRQGSRRTRRWWPPPAIRRSSCSPRSGGRSSRASARISSCWTRTRWRTSGTR